MSWFERVFGDGPIVVSMLVLVCTALGFGAAMLWLRDEESDEWDDEYEDENEDENSDWPSPPEQYPDENPPPIPQDLLDSHQEEE